ncbi:tail fiber protein [Streptomyces lunaelactis]|uniref:phage tail protein n=1 Tax=Streptomyces lunaelactis TaxID=1535768 RepID=UPI0015855E16|nr:phage tail protein [Streptomyces lunaelactis]NUK07114.1 tail fiber protein [Streptomyces lunaelactis]NUK32839.1 tail fiber protein [Streptomyces lunaelactis]NUK39742.1 tail fiber protein [Streptomyces lunaelactis]NUK56647.1 tail fiber protein [Streptomyces lunaelactis]NUK90699.1 tail fiber protein [Streptomyces lunaelactis]
MEGNPSLVPVGTITAFAGELDPTWLASQGWLYCDGSELDQTQYAALYSAIGGNYGTGHSTFFLPDLRGRFPRGVDLGAGRDPYVLTRSPSNKGGLSGNNPGSTQGYHTALPTLSFTSEKTGGHQHPVQHLPKSSEGLATAGSHYGIWPDSKTWTGSAGDHTHTVNGGDAETRPINKYVYFLIKFDG